MTTIFVQFLNRRMMNNHMNEFCLKVSNSYFYKKNKKTHLCFLHFLNLNHLILN
jgi:hypothetical protein